jgi:hypothetical protein
MKIKQHEIGRPVRPDAAGNYQVALCANNLTALNPGSARCSASKNNPTPTAATAAAGPANVPAADPLLEAVDNNLDERTRAADGARRRPARSDDGGLPSTRCPTSSSGARSSAGRFGQPIEGMFWNIDRWGLAKLT